MTPFSKTPDGALVVGDSAQRHADVVEADYRAGVAAGAEGTPTLLIDGARYGGRIDLESLREATGLS